MGVFSPGEREHFERGIRALESIADSLSAMAHPVVVIPAPKNGICPKCGGKISIRNPTGKCDHLYYPDYVR